MYLCSRRMQVEKRIKHKSARIHDLLISDSELIIHQLGFGNHLPNRRFLEWPKMDLLVEDEFQLALRNVPKKEVEFWGSGSHLYHQSIWKTKAIGGCDPCFLSLTIGQEISYEK